MPLDFLTTRRLTATAEILASEGLAQMDVVTLLDVTSSNIGRIGYDEDNRRLFVQFCNKEDQSRDGATYAYERVPNAVFEALLQADEDDDGSIGATFHRLIKKGGFGFRRI